MVSPAQVHITHWALNCQLLQAQHGLRTSIQSLLSARSLEQPLLGADKQSPQDSRNLDAAQEVRKGHCQQMKALSRQ